MIVFRVEHERTHKGPYQGNTPINGRGAAHQPAPWVDGLEVSFYEYESRRFGFKSIEDFKQWFQTDIPMLLSHNCSLFAFEVPDEHVLQGKRQLMFSQKEAKRLDYVPIGRDKLSQAT